MSQNFSLQQQLTETFKIDSAVDVFLISFGSNPSKGKLTAIDDHLVLNRMNIIPYSAIAYVAPQS
jgi:hypothetical protein